MMFAFDVEQDATLPSAEAPGMFMVIPRGLLSAAQD